MLPLTLNNVCGREQNEITSSSLGLHICKIEGRVTVYMGSIKSKDLASSRLP